MSNRCLQLVTIFGPRQEEVAFQIASKAQPRRNRSHFQQGRDTGTQRGQDWWRMGCCSLGLMFRSTRLTMRAAPKSTSATREQSQTVIGLSGHVSGSPERHKNREAAGSQVRRESKRRASFQGFTWMKRYTNQIVSGSTSTQTNCRPESRKPKTKWKTHQTKRQRDRVARVAGPESDGPRQVRFYRP